MGKSMLDVVVDCDGFPYYNDDPEHYKAHMQGFHTFRVQGCDAVLGYMLNEIAERFSSFTNKLASDDFAKDYWYIDSTARTITLATAVDTGPEDRSRVVAYTLAKMKEEGVFDVLRGWRDELYPVYGRGGKLLLEIERSACPLFGVVSYGIHMTGYVKDKNGLRIWVPKRSEKKQTFPGMYDNTVGGGMSTKEYPFECALREAEEEASLSRKVMEAKTTPVSCLSYIYVRDKKAGGETGLIQPEVEYIYDIELDADTIPKPNDSEVQEFHLLTVDQVRTALWEGKFKANCGIVVVDFLIRHGILTGENEPGYVDMLTRMHRRLEFPTASHVVS
ncbi:hypothetical protein Egran_04021 [Elaphomyces granulatus]|uniref:Nudix hydrolase domain-containing protein n=1 Tax=Elaphomyces granulatus TaxID=519963 RepID=A0A232LWN5_9EURO|nr:hypothetical protein Egran_04021 [Elaphomyces granulatus]